MYQEAGKFAECRASGSVPSLHMIRMFKSFMYLAENVACMAEDNGIHCLCMKPKVRR